MSNWGLFVVGVGIALAGGVVVLRVYGKAGWGARAKAVAKWLWKHRAGAAWTIGAASAIALVLLAIELIWYLPEQSVPTELTDQRERRTQLVNEVRRTWISVAGGILAIAALIVAALRSKAALDDARSNREGQLTERFTRAIDQLGATRSDHSRNVEVRIGGIYALEQIARDAPEKYHWQIMEVLCAYVRENHRFVDHPAPAERKAEPDEGTEPARPPPAPPQRLDVQAALTVLGRRVADNDDGQRLDLSGTDLRGYDLCEANLKQANLMDAHLERADLTEAHLEWANLYRAHLERADLTEAHLERAYLYRAHLERAYLIGAHLEGALRPEDDLREWGWQSDNVGRLHRIPDPDKPDDA